MAVSAVAGALGGLVKGIAVSAKGAAGAAAKGAGRLAVSGAKVAGRGAVRGAKAVGRGAVRGAKSAGKGLRRGAKSGKKMAKNMMKNVKEIRKQMKARKGGGGGSGESTSSKLGPSSSGSSGGSTGNPVIDNALNNIDNAILGMLKGEQQSIKDARLQDTRTQRRRREGVLERGSKFVRGLASKAPAGMKKTFDAMGKFINNVVIGSILLYILNQWDSIVEAYKKTVETLKKLWEALEPWVKGTWDFFKSIFRFVLDWSARLLGVKEPDTKSVGQNLKEMGEKLKPVKEGFDMIMKKIGEFSQWLGGKSKPDQKVDKSVEDVGKEETLDQLKEEQANRNPLQKIGDFVTGAGAEREEQIHRLETGEEKRYGFFGEKDKDKDKGKADGNGSTSAQKTGRGRGTRRRGTRRRITSRGKRGVPLGTGGDSSSSSVDNFGLLPGETVEQFRKKVRSNSVEGVDLLGTGTISKKQAAKLSQGLDTHASYEKGGGTTNVIMAKQEAPSSGGGGGGVKILPVPIVNSAKDVTKDIYKYELSKV